MEELSKSALIHAVDEVALPPTVDGILAVVRRVLLKPYVQVVHLETGRPIVVDWYRNIHDSLIIDEPDESLDVVLGKVELEEFSDVTLDPYQYLLRAVKTLNDRGLQVSYVVSGSILRISEIFAVSPSFAAFGGTEYRNFFGIRLIQLDAIPGDAIVLLGSPVREASLKEVTHGLHLVF